MPGSEDFDPTPSLDVLQQTYTAARPARVTHTTTKGSRLRLHFPGRPPPLYSLLLLHVALSAEDLRDARELLKVELPVSVLVEAREDLQRLLPAREARLLEHLQELPLADRARVVRVDRLEGGEVLVVLR